MTTKFDTIFKLEFSFSDIMQYSEVLTEKFEKLTAQEQSDFIELNRSSINNGADSGLDLHTVLDTLASIYEEEVPESKGRPYVVNLNLMQDGFEKTALHLVRATTETLAKKAALENEAHGDLDWQNEDRCEDEATGGIYEVYSVKEVSENDFKVLTQHL